MKVLVIGASGTIGSAVVAALAERHEVVQASRGHGDFRVDITRDDSVAEMFEAVGPVDAIVSTTGKLFFGPLATMRPADFSIGLQDKLLGQVRVALLGQNKLRDGGSITLTTGIAPKSRFVMASTRRQSMRRSRASCGRQRLNCLAGYASMP